MFDLALSVRPFEGHPLRKLYFFAGVVAARVAPLDQELRDGVADMEGVESEGGARERRDRAGALLGVHDVTSYSVLPVGGPTRSPSS
jgi:hypothetical protein